MPASRIAFLMFIITGSSNLASPLQSGHALSPHLLHAAEPAESQRAVAASEEPASRSGRRGCIFRCRGKNRRGTCADRTPPPPPPPDRPATQKQTGSCAQPQTGIQCWG